MKKPLTATEAKKAIVKAVELGNVKFATPFADDALATMRMDKSNPEYGLFINVDVEPWVNKQGSGLLVTWAAKGIGFGEVTLVMQNGKWTADTESMSKGFVEQAMAWWINNKVEVER